MQATISRKKWRCSKIIIGKEKHDVIHIDALQWPQCKAVSKCIINITGCIELENCIIALSLQKARKKRAPRKFKVMYRNQYLCNLPHAHLGEIIRIIVIGQVCCNIGKGTMDKRSRGSQGRSKELITHLQLVFFGLFRVRRSGGCWREALVVCVIVATAIA